MFPILLIVCIILLVDCKLKVLRPSELVDRLGTNVDMALANFGQIPFGHRMLGSIDIANPNDGCSSLLPSYGNQFVMIERGNCTFVTKVRNAQNAGYQLAIIGNNNNEPLESDFVMADDGYGYSVDIPSIFITSSNFNILKKYIQRQEMTESPFETVYILIKFDVEKKDKVDVIFSLDITNRDSYRIVDEYSNYYDLLQNKNINYTLLYSIFNYQGLYSDYQIDPNNCICSKKYCASDPDGQGVASGKHVIDEALRQTCIFKKFPQEYFKYMSQFNIKCTIAQGFSTCSSQIIDNLQIEKREITNCIEESFIDPQTRRPTKNLTMANNTILDHQLMLQEKIGAQGTPSVVVNSVAYKGQLNGKGIFGEICNSFMTPPSVCQSEVDDYYKQQSNEQNYIFWIILFISMLIAAFALILFCLFQRFVKKDSVEVTQVQVNEMVSQYIKFYEGKDQQKQNSF